MNRKIYWLLMALLFSLLLSGCAGNATQSIAPTDSSNVMGIKIGWQPSNEAPFYEAKAKGFFESNDLSAEYIKFEAGVPMIAALESGSIDVAFMGMPPAIIGLANNAPVQIFFVDDDGGGAEGLVAHKDSGIASVKDLVGKTVAVARGSSSDYALQVALKKEGLDESQLTILNLDVTTIIPSFEKRQVDAVWVWEPWMGKLLAANGKLIATDLDYGFHSVGVWVARKQWLQESPDAVLRFIHALEEGNASMQKNPTSVITTMSDMMGLTSEQSEALLKESIFPTAEEQFIQGGSLSLHPDDIQAGKGLVSGFVGMAEFLKKNGKIDNMPDLKSGFNSDPLQKYLKAKGKKE
jgi:taurine transport system substrate-binding protein